MSSDRKLAHYFENPPKKETGHQCSVPAWILYAARVLRASDLVGPIRTFGGAHAQLGLLAATLNMDTIETPTMALVYDRQVYT